MSSNFVILYFPSVFNVLFLKCQTNVSHPNSACSLTKQLILMFSKAFVSTCRDPLASIFPVGPAWKKKSFLIFNYDRFNSLRNCGVVALRNWNRLRLSPEKRDDKAGVSASLGPQLEPSHFFGSKFLIYNQSVSEGCRHASSYVYFWTHVLCQTFIISIGISGYQRRVYV